MAGEQGTIRVGVVGCSGYTASECIKLLLRHPHATVVAATSRQADGARWPTCIRRCASDSIW